MHKIQSGSRSTLLTLVLALGGLLTLSPLGLGTRPTSAPVASSATSATPAATPAAAAAPTAPAPTYDTTLDQELASTGRTNVIVRLDTELTGTDAERSVAARRSVDELLATLPAGSFSDVGDPGILPVATFRATRAAVDVLRSSPLVRAVGADVALSVASEHAQFRDGAATANALGWTGEGTTVAVIDSGVQADHPYLMNGTTKKVIGEACFVSAIPSVSYVSPCPGGASMAITAAPLPGSAGPCPYSTAPYPDTTHACDHGTHVAGVVAGQPGTANFAEISGVAPNTKLISVQVFGYKSDLKVVTSLTTDLLNSLKWLYNRRADFPGLSAVNISIASSTKKYAATCDNDDAAQQAMFAAIKALRDVNIATIVAAGNSGWNDGISSPACISNTVGVGAIDDTTGVRAPFSNISSAIELFAPGASIASAWPGYTKPQIESGTSQATPAVAGAWALLRQQYPLTATTPKTVDELLTMLRSTGTDVATTVTVNNAPVTYTAPRINISRALGYQVPTTAAMGNEFSCARLNNGMVSCTGSNASGQLGVSTATVASTTIPRRIVGLTGVTQIAAGNAFACARSSQNQDSVLCWGNNASGQLGIGPNAATTPINRVLSAVNTPLTGVSSVAAAGASACAVLNAGVNGTVRCWGDNADGQLGDGTTITRKFAVQVMATATTPLTGVKSVAVGARSACAQMNNGTVRCWGNNADGGLGNNSTVSSNYPVQVSGINGLATSARSIAVGSGFACAVLTTNTVRCWGTNASGQLGNNTTARSLVPVTVVTSTGTLDGVSTVSLGAQHACAIQTVAGVPMVRCWGNNSLRQLGIGGVNLSVATSTFGTKTDTAIAIAAGPTSTLVVTANSAVAFGKNTAGQLGLGNAVNPISPTWSLRF